MHSCNNYIVQVHLCLPAVFMISCNMLWLITAENNMFFGFTGKG